MVEWKAFTETRRTMLMSSYCDRPSWDDEPDNRRRDRHVGGAWHVGGLMCLVSSRTFLLALSLVPRASQPSVHPTN